MKISSKFKSIRVYFLCGVDPGIKCCAGCDSGISEIYEFIYL